MDKELLFKPRLAVDDVELADVGTVRIRALSRDEVAEAREDNVDGAGDVDLAGYEHSLISRSMVDPELAVDEVARWAKAAPAGEFVKVMDAIQALSGLDEEAAKSRVRPNRRERRAAVRARTS